MILHKNLSGNELHDPKSHSATHENSGGDEVSVAGLSGVLADEQNPKFNSANYKPSALPGSVMSLLWELVGIIATLETKISLLAIEAKRSNTNFDLNDRF